MPRVAAAFNSLPSASIIAPITLAKIPGAACVIELLKMVHVGCAFVLALFAGVYILAVAYSKTPYVFSSI